MFFRPLKFAKNFSARPCEMYQNYVSYSGTSIIKSLPSTWIYITPPLSKESSSTSQIQRCTYQKIPHREKRYPEVLILWNPVLYNTVASVSGRRKGWRWGETRVLHYCTLRPGYPITTRVRGETRVPITTRVTPKTKLQYRYSRLPVCITNITHHHGNNECKPTKYCRPSRVT